MFRHLLDTNADQESFSFWRNTTPEHWIRESNKSSGNVYASNNANDSFQPDPRWAGKLAELKDKLAQSGNA